MIDNSKVKKAITDWAKTSTYSKIETDFFEQIGYTGNFSRNEVITFYAGYVAGVKEAEDEKQELIALLKDIREHGDLIDFGSDFIKRIDEVTK